MYQSNSQRYSSRIRTVYSKKTPNSNISIVAIVVSYKYLDTLQIALPINAHNFAKTYVVTREDDTETIKYCRKFSNVEVVLHDFFNENRTFDKGGGIKKAQELAYKNYPSSWYLILDADIVLPTNLYHMLNSINLDVNYIYGLPRCIVYRNSEIQTLDDNEILKRLRGHKHNSKFYKIGSMQRPNMLGYFQFYKAPFFYNNSENCGTVDFEFSWKFNGYGTINTTYVYHLGDTEKNWDGKVKDFIIDAPINLNRYRFEANHVIHLKLYNGSGKAIKIYKYSIKKRTRRYTYELEDDHQNEPQNSFQNKPIRKIKTSRKLNFF